MALTTLANVKLLLGITGTAQDAQLTALLNAASARIEKWCNRSFGNQDCIEWKDGGLQITSKRTPLKKINRIAVWDGSAFGVSYTGTDPWAQVSVEAGVNDTVGTLTLASSSGSPTVLALSGTITALITAINAVANWSASGDLDGRSAWIPPMSGQDAVQASGAGPVSVPVCLGDIGIARYDWNSGVIQLKTSNFIPFGFGFGVGIDGTYDSTPMWDGTNPFPRQFRGIMLDYNGGMDPIPDDVQQTCVDLVQMMMQSAANTGMVLQSESLGGYSYTNGGGDQGPAGYLAAYDNLIKSRLAGYYRIPVSD